MAGSIEINYISPISNYSFNKKDKYYLVFINTTTNNTVILNKIELSNINNISSKIRSYFVGMAFDITNNSQYPDYQIKIFCHNLDNDYIYLLFTGSLSLDSLEIFGIKCITLNSPSKVINDIRKTKYIDMSSFLDEQFYNFETINTNNRCLMFITRVIKTNKYQVKPFIYKYDMANDNNIYIYNRYSNNIIKEFIPNYMKNIINIKKIMSSEYFYLHSINFMSKFCSNNHNSLQKYNQFIKDYQIDTNIYENIKESNYINFKSLLLRKIKDSFRLLRYDPYLNNVVISPTDGRIKAFNINDSLKFDIYNSQIDLINIIPNSYQLKSGSGFINRLTPTDYQRINIPYSGYLINIGIYKQSENMPYVVIMKFDSNYFIPPDVHEREYLSVIYGNAVGVSRGYPDLLIKQPNTNLEFYLVMIANGSTSSIQLINSKLLGITKSINLNSTFATKPTWFQQGEEIGVFNCSLGYTIFMINRSMDFSADIKYYSKQEPNNLFKPIECFVKMNDLVGLII